MDIHRNQWISKWISIKAWIIEDISIKYGYPLVDIHVPRIPIVDFLHGYPSLDINVEIHTCGQLKTDIKKSWMSIWITVDFWRFMNGWICYGFLDQQGK